MSGHPHPRDAVDDLTARFTPLAELAALIAMADEQRLVFDVRPPIAPDLARSIAKIADDIALLAAALDAYVQEAPDGDQGETPSTSDASPISTAR